MTLETLIKQCLREVLAEAPASEWRLLTLAEAAERLGMSMTLLRDEIKAGKLKTTRIGDRGVRMDSRQIDRYVAERTNGGGQVL